MFEQQEDLKQKFSTHWQTEIKNQPKRTFIGFAVSYLEIFLYKSEKKIYGKAFRTYDMFVVVRIFPEFLDAQVVFF